MSSLSFQINLQSKNANYYLNNLTSQCVFNLPDPVVIADDSYFEIAVISASIPFSFYTIDYQNQLLSYTVNSTTYNLIISQGNYDVYELQSYLSANMAGFTIGYDEKTNKYSFSRVDYEFTFNSQSTAFTILGFSSGTHTSSLKSLSSDIVVDLASVKCIYVDSNFPSFNITTRPKGNILASIPMISQSNGVIQYFNYNNFSNRVHVQKITSVIISLLDQDMNEMDLNGAHFVLTLQIDIKKF